MRHFTHFYHKCRLSACKVVRSAYAGEYGVNYAYFSHLGRHKRAHLGLSYLPQEASVFRKLSVEDNIRAILELQTDDNGRPLSREIIEKRLNELLDELQIQHIRTSMALSLSGGERRRTEIARALAANPRFILLDEPVSGLDPSVTDEMYDLIYKLNKDGITVIMISHDIDAALKYATHILQIGKDIFFGTRDEYLKSGASGLFSQKGEEKL